jgi:hypothetical protein
LILEAQPPQNGNFVLYKVDDGTGCIDVRNWVNTDSLTDATLFQPAVKEGTYARIVGNLKPMKSI